MFDDVHWHLITTLQCKLRSPTGELSLEQVPHWMFVTRCPSIDLRERWSDDKCWHILCPRLKIDKSNWLILNWHIVGWAFSEQVKWPIFYPSPWSLSVRILSKLRYPYRYPILFTFELVHFLYNQTLILTVDFCLICLGGWGGEKVKIAKRSCAKNSPVQCL